MKNLTLVEKKQQELPFLVSAAQLADDKIIVSATDGIYKIDGNGEECILPTESTLVAAHKNEALILALANGEIHVGEELAGSFPQGLKTAAFSHDGRYLALITQDDLLQLMDIDNDYDIIFDLCLGNVDFDASEHVSIGWGKKETQFHGSAGKQAAQAPSIVLPGLTAEDDGRMCLSWRVDGAYFALNYVSSCSGEQLRRIIIVDVLNRKLSAVSEAMTGLEGSLAWRMDEPSSIFMAATQLLNGTRSVVFIERNGLKHREFPLRRTVSVRKLAWSECGTVLTVLFQDDLVQLWTMKNYHWYLKAEFPCERIVDLFWRSNLELICACQEGLPVRKYISKFSSDSYAHCSPRHALVGVVDGTHILLTPFSESNVPPPMFHFKVDLGLVPEDIRIYEVGQDAFLEAISSDKLCKYELKRGDDESWSSLLIEEQQIKDSVFVNSQFCATINGLHINLDSNGELTVDDISFSSGCLSVHATDRYLMLTTTEQKLHFLSLSNVRDISELQQQMNRTGEDAVRMVERGAEILTVSPSECSLVLQMPRGNLEIIYPRPFIFDRLRELLGRLDLAEAYMVMRRHRVDLNVLVDYNTPIFLTKLGSFVEQMREPSYLNLFIANLSEGNVAKEKYAFSCDAFDFGEEGKVNTVCKALVQYLDPVRLYEPLITCQATMNPPDLVQVLNIILSLDPAVLERAIKYALFLIEPERLYRAALSIYNLPLALSLAKRSSLMDPQEYLPFLEHLSELEEIERRFQICDYLKEYEKAILVLLELGDEERIRAYVKQNNLYKQAIKVCTGELRSEILCDYSYLCQDRDKPLLVAGCDLFVADKWEYLVASGASCDVLEEAFERDPNIELAVILRKWKEASELAMAQGKYILGQRYARLAKANVSIREQLVNVSIREQLIEGFKDIVGSIKGTCTEFKVKMNRLLPLQSKFISDPMAALLLASGVSDEAASQMSFVTKKTTLTSLTSSTQRSKKKQERNKLRDKPGSPYEREFLHNCLLEALKSAHRLFDRATELKEALELEDCLGQASELCAVWNKCIREMRQLHGTFDSLLVTQRTKITEDVMELRALLEDHAKMQLSSITTLTELTSELYNI